MDKETYERECERRKTLIHQEKALRERYKRIIQQIVEIIEENDRMESRCRTLRRMIEEIPEIPKPKEDEEERSLMEEVKEIEHIMKPEI